MSTYIQPPLVTDPDALSQEVFDYLAANIPGWVPRDGHLEVWLAMSLARIVAEGMDVGSAVPTTIFRYFGGALLGVQPINATTAQVQVQFTMVDSAGYVVRAGTQIAFQPTGDTLIPFLTAEELVVPPGATIGSVGAVAATAGSASSGYGPGAMVLLDPLGSVASVAATTASSGGFDAETDEQYLDRLVDELRLLTPRPILAADFAVLARRIAGVQRALGVDNYNPADDTTDNERMVAVAAVDPTGSGIGTATKAAVAAYLGSMREINFIVNVFDPTYTTVNVTFTFTVNPGAVVANVQAAAVAAVTQWLEPFAWGVEAGDEEKETWINKPVVAYNDLISVLYDVDGLRSVPALTINGSATDLALPGKAPLPLPGTITGTPA